jgi:XRE family transcriptional regulator, master regulator for biofilm formation
MIGKNIYQLRKKRKLTLSELADRANISKSYLSNIERNLNQNPSIQVMEKIANVLDVDLKILLENASDSEKQQLEKEWLDFVHELKESGGDKDQINEYRTLIEFIKWQNTKADID